MTTGVPDTGLIEAFKPLKTGGGGNRPKPTCANCPCGLAEGAGLLCTRYPPELTMVIRQDMRGQPVQVPQVGFKPVHKTMVCWEHPAMQAKMKREVAAAEARFGGLTYASFPPSSDALAIQERVEARARVGDPGVPVHAVGDDHRKPGDDPT